MIIWRFTGVRLANVTVPNVVGLSYQEGESILKRANLNIRKEAGEYSDAVKPEVILRQSPEAGMTVKEFRAIGVTISLGSESYIVPSVIGKGLIDAQRAIYDAGLEPGIIKKVYRRIPKGGRIINQVPPAGQKVSNRIKVDLLLSEDSREQSVDVPNLVGKRLLDAEGEVFRENLTLKVIYNYIPDAKLGTVIYQSPAPDSKLKIGDRLEVTIAVPQEVKSQEVKDFTLKMRIPPGPERMKVQIRVVDRNGERYVFDEERKPEDVIQQKISIVGEGSVKVYLDDILVREDSI